MNQSSSFIYDTESMLLRFFRGLQVKLPVEIKYATIANFRGIKNKKFRSFNNSHGIKSEIKTNSTFLLICKIPKQNQNIYRVNN